MVGINLILIITLFYFGNISNIKSLNNEDLSQIGMFIDEICSYNNDHRSDFEIIKNVSNASQITNVSCTCKREYANETSPRTINGVPVQCGYERKRMFIAFFLAVFLPFGFDYLYLGWFWIFILILMFCCITIFGNCYRFTVFTETNYFKNEWNLFFCVLALIALVWWIINIFLIVTGRILDSNRIEIMSDLNLLLQII